MLLESFVLPWTHDIYPLSLAKLLLAGAFFVCDERKLTKIIVLAARCPYYVVSGDWRGHWYSLCHRAENNTTVPAVRRVHRSGCPKLGRHLKIIYTDVHTFMHFGFNKICSLEISNDDLYFGKKTDFLCLMLFLIECHKKYVTCGVAHCQNSSILYKPLAKNGVFLQYLKEIALQPLLGRRMSAGDTVRQSDAQVVLVLDKNYHLHLKILFH